MKLHLDTHAALWMVSGDRRRLRPVAGRLKRSDLFLSPIALIEMEFLREIGRLRAVVTDIWAILAEDHGVAEAPGRIHDLARQARPLAWTRDPFDRLIVAHALAHDAQLLTADETILEHCADACWS